MSFNIELMNNQEELNKISKNPASVRTLSGELRSESSIVNPVILVEFDGTLADVNYAYISEFHRYYFITNVESYRTKLWLVYLHCDVLKTYSEAILGTECVVARSESAYNLFLSDSAFKVYSDPRLQVINFPNKFSGEEYVLVTKGAQAVTSS